MRLLFLTSRLPYPPNRGDRLRVFNFIRELSREHEITLLSFVADTAETAQIAGLRPYCHDIHLVPMSRARSMAAAATGLWRPEPLQALYYRSAEMQRAVDALVAQRAFDLLYIHLFRMAPYALPHRHLYRVLDLTDVISTEIERALPYHDWRWRAIYRRELPRIRRYEPAMAGQFDETWVISAAEKAALAASGAAGRVIVVPNGVDSDRFRPLGLARDPATLLFVGHMGVAHNEDAAEFLARDLLPLVQAALPGARLSLVGADPSRRVRQLAGLPGVTVAGHVPDLNAVLNRATVFVAPLRFAAGVQNKVLEAMAAGIPVVTTPMVNDGLAATDGRHLLVADEPAALAAATLSLLTDPQRRESMARAARAFVVEGFRWDAVTRRLAAVESDPTFRDERPGTTV
jgi:sugar transferase (PEP-CTERM/EpsH1 system associated)